MMKSDDLIPIVCASDCEICPDCEEPWCSKCFMHYFECGCLGPSEADDNGFEVIEIDGKLFGRKK